MIQRVDFFAGAQPGSVAGAANMAAAFEEVTS
jgi:hypothetical protein